jgi:hypothetical protein
MSNKGEATAIFSTEYEVWAKVQEGQTDRMPARGPLSGKNDASTQPGKMYIRKPKRLSKT